MDGTSSTHGGDEKCTTILVVKPKGNIYFVRHRCGWEADDKCRLEK
jgi:hypothetical protein